MALPGGRFLLVIQTNTGKLFAVDGHTGASDDNRIAVVRLKHGAARVKRYLTDPLFDVPTTIAPFGPFLYAVNARFDRPDDSDDDIVRVRVGHHRK